MQEDTKEFSNIIKQVGISIAKKVPKTDVFDFLTNGEKIFVYIDVFEKEMKNGDLDQFFFNSSGQFTHEILEAYEAIGAKKTAEIIYKAIRLFPSIPVPKKIEIRRCFLDTMSKETQIKLTALESDFYNSDEDIVTMLMNYIHENGSQFDFSL